MAGRIGLRGGELVIAGGDGCGIALQRGTLTATADFLPGLCVSDGRSRSCRKMASQAQQSTPSGSFVRPLRSGDERRGAPHGQLSADFD